MVDGHTLGNEGGGSMQLLCSGYTGFVVDSDMHRAGTCETSYGSYYLCFGAVDILSSKHSVDLYCTRRAIDVAKLTLAGCSGCLCGFTMC